MSDRDNSNFTIRTTLDISFTILSTNLSCIPIRTCTGPMSSPKIFFLSLVFGFIFVICNSVNQLDQNHDQLHDYLTNAIQELSQRLAYLEKNLNLKNFSAFSSTSAPPQATPRATKSMNSNDSKEPHLTQSNTKSAHQSTCTHTLHTYLAHIFVLQIMSPLSICKQ